MLGLTAGVEALEDLSLGYPDQSCEVQAVVDWFGPTNFLKMDEQLTANGLTPMEGLNTAGKLPESWLLGDKITNIPEKVREANPETYIHADIPPFLIQHGKMDSTVPVQQSIELAEKFNPCAVRIGWKQIFLMIFIMVIQGSIHPLMFCEYSSLSISI